MPWRAVAALVALAACTHGQMTKIPSFYHSTDALLEEYQKLKQSCRRTLTIDSVGGLTRVHLASVDEAGMFDGKKAPPPSRGLMFFGEHARE
jgi:hypothetical protein